MKTLIIFLISGICNLAVAKESLAILNAIEEYRNNNPGRAKSDIPPEKALTEIIEKINTVPEPGITVEEILSSLANVRESSSTELVPKLKVIWSYYRKSTFRATYPEEWRYVKSMDFSQVICDEIKILIKKMGGDLDDIEPLDERITFDLNEVRTLLKCIKDGSRKDPLNDAEIKSLTKKLSKIVKQCKFGSSNEDQKLQIFYILAIIELLGDKNVCSGQNSTDANGPEILFFDETLSKALPLIDENWIQKPTGSTEKNQDAPSTEQIIQWRQNSLESYQQIDLRKLRDQILLNVSSLIKMRKEDNVFKQEMLKRFAKNDAYRKVIEERVNSKK